MVQLKGTTGVTSHHQSKMKIPRLSTQYYQDDTKCRLVVTPLTSCRRHYQGAILGIDTKGFQPSSQLHDYFTITTGALHLMQSQILNCTNIGFVQ